MKSKILTLILATVLLTGCYSSEASQPENVINEEVVEFYNAYEEIDANDIAQGSSMVDLLEDPSNAQEIYELSSTVALVTIKTIDGADNFNEKTGEYVYVYTYGTMKVHQVFKGDLEVGDEVEYVRIGGIILTSKYLESLAPQQREKHLREGVHSKYTKMVFEDDIDIETEKTYLVYLMKDENNPKSNAYAIIGFQGGLRELETPIEYHQTYSNIEDTQEMKAYNNFTQEWEMLSSIIPTQ